ncbi:MAG: glycoside hydrolase family 3 protein [Chlorobi bacterium]|nr:glycoside hydrolase family 3 protein [Chlorobiota bacterium]
MEKTYRIPVLLLVIALFLTPVIPSTFAKSRPSPKKWQAQHIFSRRDSGINKELERMTLEEKVGQMIIAQTESRYNSSGDAAYLQLQRLVREGKVGGIMFMKGDAFNAAMMANQFQSLAPRPLMMSADMERGLAMRLSGATEFPPNMALAATGDPKLAYGMAKAIAAEARTAGIHQSYSPNVDLNINPANPVINTRSFGDNVPLAVTMANAMIEGLQTNGIVATAKHFPGHGDVTVDSHIALPVLNADRQRLYSYELKPFKSAIDNGIVSIMTGHLAVPGVTGTMEPASVSKTIVTGLLRNELGFQGLIITDAMNMKALYNGNNVAEMSVRAIQAGNDLLLFSPDPELAHAAIAGAVRSGQISEAQINDSVRRILLVKKWLKLEDDRLVDLNRLRNHISPASHRELAGDIAARSITVVKQDPRHLPLRNIGASGRLLNIILQDKSNQETGREYTERLNREFPATTVRIDPKTDSLSYAATLAAARNADALLISSYVQVFSGSGTLRLSERQQQFIHTLAASVPESKPIVFISFGTPYLISAFPEIRTAICTYSSSRESEEYAIRLLKGELKPQGYLPVSLSGLTPRTIQRP